MSTTTNTTFALPPFNPHSARTALNSTRIALNHQISYHIIANYANNTVKNIEQYQLIPLLSLCSLAYGMKSKFGKATENAEDIITYAPVLPIGYFCLGNILEMQAKSAEAVKVYDEALIMVPQKNPDYPRLVQLQKAAVEKSKRYVDFVALLPLELSTCIFKLLPEVDKFTCFNVSTMWRRRMIDSSVKTWKKVYNDHHRQDTKAAISIACMLPYVAHNVEDLTINTTDKQVWLRYLEYMENGHFKKVKCLKIEDYIPAYQIKTNTFIMSLTHVLWKMKNTLTALNIPMLTQHYPNAPFYLSDLLFYCSNLTKLVIRANGRFDDHFGDMDILGEPRNALVDVELKGYLHSGALLAPFLKYHPNIQRLNLSNCIRASDTLYYINEYCQSLKLLGYNTSCNTTLEELAIRNRYDYFYPSGIQEIVTYKDVGVPAEKLLLLLQNNLKSIKKLNANMGNFYGQTAAVNDEFPLDPSSWRFERLENFQYTPDSIETESVFLQLIESCTTLKTFEVRKPFDIQAIVDTLTKLPGLEEFRLFDTEYLHNGRDALPRLFNTYAKTTRPTSKRKLRIVSFAYCDIITKEVLDAVVALETIEAVEFSGTSSISSYQDLVEFLKKMSQRLTHILFTDNDVVDGNILSMLCNMPRLETIILTSNRQVTEENIKNLVDNLPPSLRRLKIVDYVISRDLIKYVKQRMYSAEI